MSPGGGREAGRPASGPGSTGAWLHHQADPANALLLQQVHDVEDGVVLGHRRFIVAQRFVQGGDLFVIADPHADVGGGFDGPNPYNIMNFIQRVPDGACLTLETLMRSVAPVNALAIALGLHSRCGNEDTIWGAKGEKMTSVQQIKQLVRLSEELGRGVADGKEARDIYRIGEWYADADETLAKLGWAPNRQPGQIGFTGHA